MTKTNYFSCNRSLKWICDFIVVQCSRPRQAHSKDLHSTIVAAFHCCKTWILHHPYLLQDKDCIATVLEVIELGISGTKSQAKATEPVVMKDKKISQPASRRVRSIYLFSFSGILKPNFETLSFRWHIFTSFKNITLVQSYKF